MSNPASPINVPWAKDIADELRAVFGADGINAEIRKGNYYIRENGHELGKRAPDGVGVTVRDMVLESQFKSLQEWASRGRR